MGREEGRFLAFRMRETVQGGIHKMHECNTTAHTSFIISERVVHKFRDVGFAEFIGSVQKLLNISETRIFQTSDSCQIRFRIESNFWNEQPREAKTATDHEISNSMCKAFEILYEANTGFNVYARKVYYSWTSYKKALGSRLLAFQIMRSERIEILTPEAEFDVWLEVASIFTLLVQDWTNKQTRANWCLLTKNHF